MAQPTLHAWFQGQGAVAADNLNTFVQVSVTTAQLRGFIGLENMAVYLLGLSTPGDGGQGMFYWNPTATGPDDGSNVIVPTGSADGAWLRLSTDS